MRVLVAGSGSLSDLHIRMLEAGEFHVDGWTSQRGREAVADLEARGLITTFEGGSEQYTSINCTVTPAGHFALAKAKGLAIEANVETRRRDDLRTCAVDPGAPRFQRNDARRRQPS
jgi:hypothetical protein